jgi:hypothetical protein
VQREIYIVSRTGRRFDREGYYTSFWLKRNSNSNRKRISEVEKEEYGEVRSGKEREENREASPDIVKCWREKDGKEREEALAGDKVEMGAEYLKPALYPVPDFIILIVSKPSGVRPPAPPKLPGSSSNTSLPCLPYIIFL